MSHVQAPIPDTPGSGPIRPGCSEHPGAGLQASSELEHSPQTPAPCTLTLQGQAGFVPGERLQVFPLCPSGCNPGTSAISGVETRAWLVVELILCLPASPPTSERGSAVGLRTGLRSSQGTETRCLNVCPSARPGLREGRSQVLCISAPSTVPDM